MITIIGLGFVGLTTGLCFAKKGFITFGIDINTERMAAENGSADLTYIFNAVNQILAVEFQDRTQVFHNKKGLPNGNPFVISKIMAQNVYRISF